MEGRIQVRGVHSRRHCGTIALALTWTLVWLEAEVDALGSGGGSRQRGSGSGLPWTLRLVESLSSTSVTGAVRVGHNGRQYPSSVSTAGGVLHPPLTSVEV